VLDGGAPGALTLVEPETRTLIVADDPLYGEGVKLLLEGTGHGPVYRVDSIERAYRFCSSDTEYRRHIVLWFVDVLDHETFGPGSGLRQLSSTGLCVVAESVDVELVQELVRERAGWLGVLLRGQKPGLGQIARTLAQLADRTATVDCRILQRVVANGQLHALANLNAMDQRVLELVAAGLRNGEIARRTRRSEKAVEKHVGRLFAKLGLDPREDAILDRRVSAAKLFYSSRRVPSLAEA
jgi:DNA-binding NarL/FixJ family response regulator